jgi:hypothetical protein
MSAATTYRPQPGTVAFRACAHLRVHPGREFSTAQLAVALDVEANGLSTVLRPAKAAGLISARARDGLGKTMWWRAGGEPEPDEDADDRRTADPTVVPRPGELFPGYAPAAQPSGFRAGHWTDGSLILVGAQVRPDGVVILSADQTLAVRHLLAWSAA